MLVKELIEELSKYNQDLEVLEVLITDGYDCNFYRGEYTVTLFKDDCEYVDIGVGGKYLVVKKERNYLIDINGYKREDFTE